jgi:hypothetical protein
MLYTISLYLHIVGALTMFFAIGIEWMCLVNLRKSRTRENILTWLNCFSMLKKIFPIAFLLLLIPGIYMMTEIWVNAAWAILGIIGLISLSISGSVLSGKKMIAVKMEAVKSENEFPLSKLLLKVGDKYFWNSFLIRGFTAVGIVFLMTFKTNLADSLIVLAVSILLGYLTGQMTKSPVLLVKTEIKGESVLQ